MTPNLLLGLVLLLPAHLSALGCNSLKLEQQRLNSESLKMLQVAGRKFPEECLENMTSFNLPAKTLKGHRPEFATKAIGEMLQGYFSILSGDLVKSEWKPTIANRFLSMLHAQIERIQRCLAKKEATLGRSTTEWKTTLKLKKYFQRIRVFIKENGQSSCAWDILRLELQMGFTHIDILTQRMDI
ncbi:interferon omega-1-like [Anolis sagrei]|uniref:interferon omega-1-like n=1 Tax=Anolis sagrei TaxID=38937 RepID=UPI0035211DB5